MYAVFESQKIIYEAHGKMVPGLANRNGHRYNKQGTRKWGGKREKCHEVKEESWLEAGAKEVLEEKKTFREIKLFGHHRRPINQKNIFLTFSIFF